MVSKEEMYVRKDPLCIGLGIASLVFEEWSCETPCKGNGIDLGSCNKWKIEK